MAQESSENHTLPTVLIAVITTVLVLVGGLWFLNNTRLGIHLKCELLNDVGACLTYGLIELSDYSPAPAVTTDPRIAEQQAAQRVADRAVEQASSNLSFAVDALRSVAIGASDAADSLGGSLDSIEEAINNERETLNELTSMIAAGSTGDFWVDDVTFKLYDVQYAREEVSFAVSGFEFDAYQIQYASDTRDQLMADVRAATAELESELARYPGASAPRYSVAQGRADLANLQALVDGAITAYEDAQDQVESMVAEADSILEGATRQAEAVGAGGG